MKNALFQRAMAVALAAVLLIFSPVVLLAQNPPGPQPPKKLTTVEGITEYRLDNGLIVLLFPDASNPVVTVNLTIFVGSRHEGYGETGMAHLLEHMVFKGTPTFPDVPKALRDHSARFNGSTWLDRTNYYETMPATDENLEFGIHLEADRMVNSLIKREDLISEMTVVRNEFEQGENSPEQILSQRITAVAYEWHNYGKSTIGNRSDIERVPIGNLQQFYKKHYQPDNAMLVVAGQFDEKKALGYIHKYFGKLPKPKRKLDATYTEEPAQDGERSVTLRRVGSVGVVGAAYHVPAGAHPDYPAVEILENVLTMEPAGRLYKALVESKKASAVNGYAFGMHDPGLLEVGATCDPSKLDEVRNTLIDTVESLAKKPISDEEVERSRTQLLKDREELWSNSARLAVQLSEWAAKGDWRLFFVHRDRLEKVKSADVNRVAQKYLVQSNRTVGLFIPTEKPLRAEVPSTPNVSALVKDYKGRGAIKVGEAFDPTPANLDKRLQVSAIGPVKVGLLPKQTRGETVVAQIVLRFGNEESLKGRTTALELMADMLTRGTKKRSRQQIQDELDKLKAKVSASAEVGALIVSVESKRNTFAATLELATDILREPAFLPAELETLKRESVDEWKKRQTDPLGLAFVELQRRMNPYPKEHPLYVPTIAEEIARIEAVTANDIRKAYAEQVAAQAGEIAVIGDFDAAKTTQQLQKLLEGWTSQVKYVRIPRPAFPKLAGAREVINTPDKANALYVAGLSFELGDNDPDYPALEIGNYMFGGGSMVSRLGTRIREKEGLSYGVNSIVQASPRDKASRFMMYAICNPKNMDKVDQAIAEETAKYLADGPSLTELADAQKAWLGSRQVARTQDRQLATQIINNLSVGRSFEYSMNLESKVAKLGPPEVKAAFRKHIDPKRLIIIRAGDFGKKK